VAGQTRYSSSSFFQGLGNYRSIVLLRVVALLAVIDIAPFAK